MRLVICELRVIIKRDLMKKMGTAIAFNTLDQWWEEAERRSKVIIIYTFLFCLTTQCNFYISQHLLLTKSLNLDNQLLTSIVF